MYALPGEHSEVVAELEPTDAVLLTGRVRNLTTAVEDEGQGIFTEVELADGYGWVQMANFYHFGAHQEATAEFIDEVPPTEDARELVGSVGERATGGEPGTDQTSEDPGAEDYGPDWVVVTGPEDFDEDFYRVDVTGRMDDSVAGRRLFVYVDEAAGGYELARVDATALCYRGVSEDGLCV